MAPDMLVPSRQFQKLIKYYIYTYFFGQSLSQGIIKANLNETWYRPKNWRTTTAQKTLCTTIMPHNVWNYL